MTTADDFVLQLALERGLVTRSALASAPDAANGGSSTVLESLVARGAVNGAALARAVAEQFDLPFVEFGAQPVAPDALAALPRAFARRRGVCPYQIEDGTLWVAVRDPLDVELLDDLAQVCALPVLPCVAGPEDLQRAIARHLAQEGDVAGSGSAIDSTDAVAPEAEPASGEATVTAEDAPLIRLVHEIIEAAVRRRASDIHLEPLERRFRVRYRIDGTLVEADSPPKALQLAVVSRVKLMANISIAEKRVPQDGRIQVSVDGKAIDLRVASLPTAHGESVVMRILDQEGLRLGLPELGFLGEEERAFSRLISSPDGIVLVTGPTGSGKTTTLYACLHHLNRVDRKVITVEDPVEYQLAGINQVPVRAEVGMTFASALRAMLRQAPNVVMVGEIRDRETAEIALNASLTGHLVFSTLHTNDAPGAVTRLVDLGAKPFLIAASLRATVAQRLVRRVCRACAVPHEPSRRELALLGLGVEQVGTAGCRRGVGCPECSGTGYRGRVGIFEIFFMTDEIRALVAARASGARLRASARRAGMRSLREDGVRKVLAGLTTIDEVLAVTVADADQPDLTP